MKNNSHDQSLEPSFIQKRWKYLIMIFVGIMLFPLALAIFGQGDVTAVLVVLPALPLWIGGMCGLAGVFDFD